MKRTNAFRLMRKIEKKVDNTTKRVLALDWGNAMVYGQWLAQTYFYVKHTTSFLALMVGHFGPGRRDEQYHCLGHLREERGHDMLLVNDLKRLKMTPQDFTEFAETRLFYQSQYYLIEHCDPVAHLGYSLFLEGLACKTGPQWCKALLQSQPKEAISFLRVHAEADQDHFAEGLEVLYFMTNEQLLAIEENLDQSYLMYNRMLKKIERLARRSQQPSRKKSTPVESLGIIDIVTLNKILPMALKRTPEPRGVTDNIESVVEYNKVFDTNLMSNYSIALDMVHRVGRHLKGGVALDLCCGPGFFTLALAEHLNLGRVIGIDLSKPMIEKAGENAFKSNLSGKVQFSVGDAMELNGFKPGSFDLVTFVNSAHHFDSIAGVQKVLQNAERVAKPDGLIVMSDLGRLKTKLITDSFVQYAGSEFVAKNMPNMYLDFFNSMYAAWSPEELAESVNFATDRRWFHIVPQDLSSLQVIIGIPADQPELFLRDGLNWKKMKFHRSIKSVTDYKVLAQAFATAEIKELTAAHADYEVKKAA